MTNRKELEQRIRRRVRQPVWTATTTLLRPSAPLRVLPDYLIIGAQRCGTTTLQGVLSEHPNIASARLMKGVHYFDTAYQHDLSWYRTHFHTRFRAGWVERRTGSPLLVGEASPYYLFHPLALSRIQRDLPGVKLIALLRDPVERTISHHKHEVRRGNETLDLAAALDREDERLRGEVERIIAEQPAYNSHAHQTYSYQARSRYDAQIEVLLEHFPADRTLILQSERFFTDPGAVYRHTLEFLGAPEWAPAHFPRENATPDATVPERIRARLIEQFEKPNQRLFDLIGESFEWQ